MTKNPSRRRKERAEVIQRIKGVFLSCPALHPEKRLRVINVSEVGLGVDSHGLNRSLNSNEIIEGFLDIGTSHAPIRLKLARQTPKIVGFELVDPSPILQSAIRLFFEAELAGASLRLIHKNDTEYKYEDSNKNSLELQIASGKDLQKFSIQTLGNQVQWEKGKSLVLVQNQTQQSVPSYLRNLLTQFIENTGELDQQIRHQIKSALLNY